MKRRLVSFILSTLLIASSTILSSADVLKEDDLQFLESQQIINNFVAREIVAEFEKDCSLPSQDDDLTTYIEKKKCQEKL